jgi:hypothetical protein
LTPALLRASLETGFRPLKATKNDDYPSPQKPKPALWRALNWLFANLQAVL